MQNRIENAEYSRIFKIDFYLTLLSLPSIFVLEVLQLIDYYTNPHFEVVVDYSRAWTVPALLFVIFAADVVSLYFNRSGIEISRRIALLRAAGLAIIFAAGLLFVLRVLAYSAPYWPEAVAARPVPGEAIV